MKPHVSVVTLGVEDVARARKFYAEGLGWPVHHEHGDWVCFALGTGASALGLLPRAALAADAGLPEAGRTGGATLSYVVGSDERVGAVLAEAERAGGRVVKPAQRAAWGGTFGWFADPEGHLWKVVAGGPFAAE